MLIDGAAKARVTFGKITSIANNDRNIAIFIFLLILLRILRVFTSSFHAKPAGSNLVKNVEDQFCRTT